MEIDIITVFPEVFYSFIDYSLLKRAQEERVLDIRIHNLRDFTTDLHRTVDDKPFGGGRGMVLKIEPIYKSVQSLKLKSKRTLGGVQQGSQNQKLKVQDPKSKVILFSPRGKKFNQGMATNFSQLDQLIMVCGRYEAVDERVADYIADEVISIGDYVLMSGDVAALVVLEAVARLVPGVVGKSQALRENRLTKRGGFREYPQYTRPEVFKPEPGVEWKVPEVLLSGHHEKIKDWRKKHTKVIE